MISSSVLDLRCAARAQRPALEHEPRALAGVAIATWRGRMVNEYASATVFEALAGQLRSAGFEGRTVAECESFTDEERNHGVLCGAVVEALGGEARALFPTQREYPKHEDASPIGAALRNLVHVCCMSETVAVALIGAERLEMPGGPLREILTRIYADEVGHARFGWRLLGTVGPDLSSRDRSAVERYLPIAFAHLEAHELAHLPDRNAPPGGERLGLCSGSDARSLLYDTIERVIRPGLRPWFDC